ncbi:hypothetical protein HVPorG_02996 [Roseomonas mucosa]|uniref:hypothetical protein n=1 Tax=Roseomonas TaxID=125216 RepID=UPI0003007DB8|nr:MULTISPECIES: hypothetical protein [Roseomonas]MBS5903294.1 hypothetical protein [Acetobacteraceae bacterium]MDT8292176.1 hypothetical protein [Roseomonas mucosa]MDT8294716.1 hypothetical protein [Roseomonas mucosa]MDT8314930.1 hypothetical protein [Roseomonas mucosa]MDT8349637.1 hypothetical protein [Roseomonas mucosa]
MIKASLLLMLGLTILVAMTLRWRERHYPPAPPPQPTARPRRARRPSLLREGKRTLDRWVTAAAIAACLTIVLMGGLHYLKLWQN